MILFLIVGIFVCFCIEASLPFPLQDCDGQDKEFLVIFDCRRDVSTQIDRISRIAIGYLRKGRGWGNFPVTYMTYTPNGLVQMNASDFKSLNSSSGEIEKNCSSEVPVDEIFEMTKKWFQPKPKTLQISFILLNSNITSTMPDPSAVKAIAERQDKATGVNRYFLIATQNRAHFAEKNFLFYMPSFQEMSLTKLYLAVCDVNCTQGAFGYFNGVHSRSNYYSVKISNDTRLLQLSQWKEVCLKKYSSGIARIDSDEELKVFIDAFLNSTQSSSSRAENVLNILVEHNNIENRSNHIHGKSPTPEMAALSSNQTCGYLRLTLEDNFTLSRGGDLQVIGGYRYEWRSFNCSGGLNNVYLACECQTTQREPGYNSGAASSPAAVWVVLSIICLLLQQPLVLG